MTAGSALPLQPGAGPARAQAVGIGLWVFIGVASALFSLLLLAFALRMNGSDWAPVAMPWQSWLATASLVAGSLALQAAARAAEAARPVQALHWLLVGGACAALFIGLQSWAWQALQAAHVLPAANPAAGFFYLLTAMHGLHVIGGLAGWAVTVPAARREADRPSAASLGRLYQPASATWRIRLCARYWHFLLAVWLLLFGAMGWLSPDFVRLVCGTR